MIYEYRCKKCGHEQEEHVKMGKKPEKSCEKCKAPPEELERILSAHAKMKFNWGKWNI